MGGGGEQLRHMFKLLLTRESVTPSAAAVPPPHPLTLPRRLSEPVSLERTPWCLGFLASKPSVAAFMHSR